MGSCFDTMIPACPPIAAHPSVMELNKIAHIEGHQATALRGRMTQLDFIGQAQALRLHNVNDVIASFAQRGAQGRVDILIQEEPGLHRRSGDREVR